MKKWYQSKTVQLAFLQAVAGFLAVLLSTHPEVDTVGVLAIVKSLVDLYLRSVTKEPIDSL